MAHNRTDDTSRFMNAIAAFSAAPEEITVCGRLIGAQGACFVDAILAEINETVLRRIVHFETCDAVRLSLDVSERRIHRLHALPSNLEEKYHHILGRNLTEQDAAVFVEITDAMSRTGSMLYVRASLPDRTDTPGFDGLSIAQVLAAKDYTEKVSDLPAQITDAVSEARKNALSLCVWSGETSLICLGDAVSCDALEEVSRVYVADSAAKPFVRLWQGGLFTEHALLLAALHGYSVAMFVPEQQVQEQFIRWHRSAFGAAVTDRN